VRALRSLADAIGKRGGQRRARPYIASNYGGSPADL